MLQILNNCNIHHSIRNRTQVLMLIFSFNTLKVETICMYYVIVQPLLVNNFVPFARNVYINSLPLFVVFSCVVSFAMHFVGALEFQTYGLLVSIYVTADVVNLEFNLSSAF